MEIENLYQENVHHGHNIRRIRKSKGMKQEDLASQVGMTQQNLSKIELRDTLNEEILARFAKVLDVPVEQLKMMEETDSAIYIENNIFENNPNSILGISKEISGNSITSNDSIQKITQLYEDKITLLNSLLKEEKEKNETLEKRISSLEDMLGKKE